MADEAGLARGWFLKAESDLDTAKHMPESEGPYDTVCFHAQQAVEKYLKGLLAFRGRLFPPTHNLEELQRLGEALPAWPIDLAELSSYAVEVRDDFEFRPDHQTAQEAFSLAEKMRKRVLGIIPAQPSRKD
jgi:HEPN domain-containing protein